MAEDPLNPKRKTNPRDPTKCLPKVFIAYPRKPTVYEQLAPPDSGADDPQLWRQFEDLVIQHGRATEVETRAHEEAVKKFADFLITQWIAVAYDLLVRDRGIENITRWYQDQINDCDYLLLIVTPSLREFLNQRCPPDKEPLFTSDYLYNLIHSPRERSDGRKPLQIVPVFLHCVKTLGHVPTALQGACMYEIWDESYTQPLSEGLTSLLCRLTGQSRYQPPDPSPAPIVFVPQRRKFAPGNAATVRTAVPATTTTTATTAHMQMSSQDHRTLDMRVLSRLSEKREFSRYWKQIGEQLGLSEAEIERCEGRSGSDENEACLQMLKLCAERQGSSRLTVGTLSDAITNSGLHFLLHILQSVTMYIP